MPDAKTNRQVTAAAMSVKQFERWAGVGHTTVYSEIKFGRLSVKKCGRRTLVLVSEAERWLAALPTYGQARSKQAEHVDKISDITDLRDQERTPELQDAALNRKSDRQSSNLRGAGNEGRIDHDGANIPKRERARHK